ncbi:voltage-dependent calcium channel subunit alpha-2/delta-3-like, partial [Asbolus verrucosus]
VTDGSEKDPLASQVPHSDKTKLPLYRKRHFYNIPVNTNYSAVHVPSNVYERSKEVISGIIWSEELDKIFKSNYKLDPSLSWQYFGSSTGFMRQFPAMIWSQEPIDLFDCRTRSWYIEAASSPKDIVILVDRSGSMTGMRREIARHVVHNILDTLGNNDYVNIYTFSNTTDPLVECFDNMLVQANLANVRVLKEGMTSFKTEQIANFSLALVTAFELLETYRLLEKGANCNQAIMLVTDGVQYNYKEIFEKYNWQNLPFVNVRVFTYLIGREVSDVREVKWMACANRGYYVHLSTYAEVREEVLHYIPVMARPMVLNATQKPNPTWSPVYADVTDPKLTNWLWINRERNRQRERFLAYRRNKVLLPPDEQDKKFVHQQKYVRIHNENATAPTVFLQKQDNYGELQTYRLMTSVSLPVYDKKPRAERVANLLGVAGTDIPIEYIESLMLPYRLGVNGYAFIVSNNGYILIHPDLRPVYQGILKPAYNRVDVTEIEIMDDDAEPREFSDEIRELRKRIVMLQKGNVTLKVKTHIDDMVRDFSETRSASSEPFFQRRLITSKRHYYYMGLNSTPFSLVIALPHKYGFYRVQHLVENDIHRIRSNNKNDDVKGLLTQFFTGNWTVHPDWHYCRYLDDRYYFENPQEEFLHFLMKVEGRGWKWSKECDRKLFCKVVADAKITSWFSQNITTTTKEENGAQFIRRFGITVAFLATHSGLTRWQDFPQNIDASAKEEPAVEHYYIDPMTFVYSVPFDIGDENNTLLTVSHAIFREEGDKKAPAAVIGYQSYHSALYAFFTSITKSCGDIPCTRTCESEELHCLLLDDNGYVIISDNLAETGYFFGRIRPDIMSMLVEDSVYKVTRMYDYQGLCPEEQETTNPATPIFTVTKSKIFALVLPPPLSVQPLMTLSHFFRWIFGMFLTLTQLTQTLTLATEDIYFYHRAVEEQLRYGPCDEETYLWMGGTLLYLTRAVTGTELETMMYPEQEDHEEHLDHEQDPEVEATDQPSSKLNEKEFDQRLLIKKTKPEPCDHEMWLYNLVHYTERNISSSGYDKTMTNCTRPFIVQRVSGSNMIFLVVNNLCREKSDKVPRMPDPVKVDYNMTLACYRVAQNAFPRRQYMSCINRNANVSEVLRVRPIFMIALQESEIKLCGGAGDTSPAIVSTGLLCLIVQLALI